MRYALALLLLASCVATPKPLPEAPVAKPDLPATADQEGAARAVVQRFVMAAEAGRFEEVHSLLSKPLRDKYSVELLARDYGADPLAAARLTQIKLKSSGSPLATKEAASLEWASGRSLRLVLEPEGWRIAALE